MQVDLYFPQVGSRDYASWMQQKHGQIAGHFFLNPQALSFTVANFSFHQELQDKATLSFSYLQMASLESLARH